MNQIHPTTSENNNDNKPLPKSFTTKSTKQDFPPTKSVTVFKRHRFMRRNCIVGGMLEVESPRTNITKPSICCRASAKKRRLERRNCVVGQEMMFFSKQDPFSVTSVLFNSLSLPQQSRFLAEEAVSLTVKRMEIQQTLLGEEGANSKRTSLEQDCNAPLYITSVSQEGPNKNGPSHL